MLMHLCTAILLCATESTAVDLIDLVDPLKVRIWQNEDSVYGAYPQVRTWVEKQLKLMHAIIKDYASKELNATALQATDCLQPKTKRQKEDKHSLRNYASVKIVAKDVLGNEMTIPISIVFSSGTKKNEKRDQIIADSGQICHNWETILVPKPASAEDTIIDSESIETTKDLKAYREHAIKEHDQLLRQISRFQFIHAKGKWYRVAEDNAQEKIKIMEGDPRNSGKEYHHSEQLILLHLRNNLEKLIADAAVTITEDNPFDHHNIKAINVFIVSLRDMCSECATTWFVAKQSPKQYLNMPTLPDDCKLNVYAWSCANFVDELAVQTGPPERIAEATLTPSNLDDFIVTMRK